MLERIASLATTRPRLVAALGVGLAVITVGLGVRLLDRLPLDAGAPSGTDSGRLGEQVAAADGFDPDPAMVVGLSGDVAVRSAAFRSVIDVLDAQIRSDPEVGSVRRSRPSADGRNLALVVRFLDRSRRQARDAVKRLSADLDPGRLELRVGGRLPELAEADRQTRHDVLQGALLGLPLLILALVIAFGGSVIAAGGVAVGALSLASALLALGLTGRPAAGLAAAAVVGGGLAIENARSFQAALGRAIRVAGTGADAIVLAVTEAGRGIVFSGVAAAAVAFACLALPADEASAAALGAATAAVAATLASLVLLPACALVPGARLVPTGEPTGSRNGTRRRAGVLLGVGATLLVAIAVGAGDLESVGFSASELPPASSPRVADRAIAKTLGPGVGSPVLIEAAAGPRNLRAYSRAVRAVRGVAGVSLLSAVGERPALLAVRIRSEPGTVAAQGALGRFRALKKSFPVSFGGATAGLVDTRETTLDRLPSVAGLALLGLAVVVGLTLAGGAWVGGTLAGTALALLLAAIGLAAAAAAGADLLGWSRIDDVFGEGTSGTLHLGSAVAALVGLGSLLAARTARFQCGLTEARLDGLEAPQAVSLAAAAARRSAIAGTVVLVVVFGALALSAELPAVRQFAVLVIAALLVDTVAVRLLLEPAAARLALADRLRHPKLALLPRR